MAIIAAILGYSGVGKTASTIINKDGSVTYPNIEDKSYTGMDYRTHAIINLDGKPLSFRPLHWNQKNENCYTVSTLDGIKKAFKFFASKPNIRTISLDTINVYFSNKEYNERERKIYDVWKDIVNEMIEINKAADAILREDQILYIFGHTALETQPDGTEREMLSLGVGKKTKKSAPEALYTICFMARLENGLGGDNYHYFETKANKSVGKTPIGMFEEFKIPNSLRLVTDTIYEYYGLPSVEDTIKSISENK